MSLIIKVTINGSSQEYLFNKLGPILIGSDKRCDLCIDDSHVGPKMLEVKVSGGNIFVKEIGTKAELFLDSAILPFREEVRYHEGSVITLKDTNLYFTIAKSVSDVAEPPPFFENEFKDRLDRIDFKIREKEVELKHLGDKEEKKKLQIVDLEDKYHHHLSLKGRLEAEVTSLKTQKDAMAFDLKKSQDKNQETEDKILELKDFVKKLEAEERTLKETIVAQNLVLAGLKDEREKKSKDVDKQRILLANLELDTLKAQEELKNVKAEFEDQEKSIFEENAKVEMILVQTDHAVKEKAKIQGYIAQSMKEKALLEHEIKDLQSNVTKLETQRKETQGKLLDLKSCVEKEEQYSSKLREEIRRQEEQEANLKILNAELRAEINKVEEKLSSKRTQLNKTEYQEQDIVRKLGTLHFELERTSLKLSELQSEEKAQELKVIALRDEYSEMSKKVSEERKNLLKDMDEEKSKGELILSHLRQEIETEKKNLAQIESSKNICVISLEELQTKQKHLAKEKNQLEGVIDELKTNKTQIEGQLVELKGDILRFQHEKDRNQRELNALQMKLHECGTEMKEAMENARVEMENYKREERAKLAAEKEVYLAEVEAFRQKSLIEVENEYRKKEEDLHQKKNIALKEADEILREARRTESLLTDEANKRLREATLEAQQRETLSHQRIQEAQNYFKQKEREAEEIIQKSKIESRHLLQRAEHDLLDDLQKRKAKIKKFLTLKQETGLAGIKQMTDQHMLKLKRHEEKALDKLEDLKRKELKKVARLREEELSKEAEMREAALNEVKSHKEKALREINELKRTQEAELAEKKKYMLDHINQQKFRTQKSWEEDMKREREQFEQTKKDRIQNATLAVMNVFITETGSPGEKEQVLREKIKSTLEMAIDGQKADALKEVDQILDFNPTKRKKVIPVMKKYALRFGVPAAVAVVMLADVGGARTGLITLTKDLIKQQQSASEIYVNQQKTEWKEKHTYNPEQTIGYKASFVDNVIYTKDFQAVMDNEEFQNDWILQVHDFMTKQLELSEDVAINYISSEGTLLKELTTVRGELHPKFLDQGLKKMNDLEVTHLGWLKEKIPEAEKMVKFQTFRKEYYDKFYNEKFLKAPALPAVRDLASDEKIP